MDGPSVLNASISRERLFIGICQTISSTFYLAGGKCMIMYMNCDYADTR